MRLIATILFVVLLSGCAVGTLRFQTPQQSFYGIVSDYTRLQSVALAYIKRCRRVKMKGCEAHSKKIKAIDLKGSLLIKSVTIKKDGIEYVETISRALTIVLGELNTYLVRIGEKSNEP